jgi:hypothetical protein
VCFSLYYHACFCHTNSTDELFLDNNNFTGIIPSQIALMSNLSESSVVWLLVVMIVVSCVFHCTLMSASLFSFYSLVGSLLQ